jgi:hypothetical protein
MTGRRLITDFYPKQTRRRPYDSANLDRPALEAQQRIQQNVLDPRLLRLNIQVPINASVLFPVSILQPLIRLLKVSTLKLVTH